VVRGEANAAVLQLQFEVFEGCPSKRGVQAQAANAHAQRFDYKICTSTLRLGATFILCATVVYRC
jgi:hypothetical protein